MAATKKSPSEKPSGDTVGFGPHASLDHAKLAQGVQIIGLLERIDAKLEKLVAVIPKPQTVVTGLASPARVMGCSKCLTPYADGRPVCDHMAPPAYVAPVA